MKLTRRAFLVMTGAAWAFERVLPSRADAPRIVVMDADLVRHVPASMKDANIVSLSGDAGWLWHEYLFEYAMQPSQMVGGITRPADAFIFARLASDIGLHATQRALSGDAVHWTLLHRA
jgi:hypothetical protein